MKESIKQSHASSKQWRGESRVWRVQNGFNTPEYNPVEELRRARLGHGELQAKIMDAHAQHEAALRALDEHVSMRTDMSNTDTDDMVGPLTPFDKLTRGAEGGLFSFTPLADCKQGGY